jgi:hypothetical protein
MTLETPFLEHTALFTLKTDQPHPRLGNGLLATLKIPILYDQDDANEFCIELNFREARLWSKVRSSQVGMPFIGNWSTVQSPAQNTSEPSFGPAFSCFLPNFLYQPGLAETITLYAFSRARWVRETCFSERADRPLDETLRERLERLGWGPSSLSSPDHL